MGQTNDVQLHNGQFTTNRNPIFLNRNKLLLNIWIEMTETVKDVFTEEIEWQRKNNNNNELNETNCLRFCVLLRKSILKHK